MFRVFNFNYSPRIQTTSDFFTSNFDHLGGTHDGERNTFLKNTCNFIQMLCSYNDDINKEFYLLKF